MGSRTFGRSGFVHASGYGPRGSPRSSGDHSHTVVRPGARSINARDMPPGGPPRPGRSASAGGGRRGRGRHDAPVVLKAAWDTEMIDNDLLGEVIGSVWSTTEFPQDCLTRQVWLRCSRHQASIEWRTRRANGSKPGPIAVRRDRNAQVTACARRHGRSHPRWHILIGLVQPTHTSRDRQAGWRASARWGSRRRPSWPRSRWV